MSQRHRHGDFDITLGRPCEVAATSPGDLEATSHCDVAATSQVRPTCDIALRRRSDIAKRNHLGREGGRGDVAATFVKVAAMSLRLSCDLNFLLGFFLFNSHILKGIFFSHTIIHLKLISHFFTYTTKMFIKAISNFSRVF